MVMCGNEYWCTTMKSILKKEWIALFVIVWDSPYRIFIENCDPTLLFSRNPLNEKLGENDISVEYSHDIWLVQLYEMENYKKHTKTN